MRFLHLGDIHLEEGIGLQDTVDALAVVGSLARAQQIDVLACPGDIYNKKSSRIERMLFGQWLFDLPCRVLLCKGNHDAEADLSVFNGYEGVHYTEDPIIEETGDCDVMLLPWPSKATLASWGLSPEETLTAGGRELGNLIKAMAQTRKNPKRPLLVFGHLSLCGAIASSGQPLVGREIQIQESDLLDLEADYIGLNHIHKPQKYYAGSLTVQDHGEEGEKKRVVIFDTKTRLRTDIGIEGRRWVTLTAATEGNPGERSVVEDDPLELGPDKVFCLSSAYDGMNVRYQYTCEEGDTHLFNRAEIEQRFAGAHNLVIDPHVERAHRARSEEVATAKTAPDRLKAWGASTGIEITPAILAKLATLEERVTP